MKTDGTSFEVSDVYFQIDNMYTYFSGEVLTGGEFFDVPLLRGYGNVVDLTIAASGNSQLKSSILQLNDMELDSNSFQRAIRNVIMQWAGTDSITPSRITDFVDSQELATMEAFFGEQWEGQVNQFSSPILRSAWDKLYSGIYSKVLLNTAYGSQVSSAKYHAESDSVLYSGDLTSLISELNGIIDIDLGSDPHAFWSNLKPLVINAAEYHGVSNADLLQLLSDTVSFDFITNIFDSTEDFWGDELSNNVEDTSENNFIKSLGGDDTVITSGGFDTVFTGDGNDFISASVSSSHYGDLGEGNDSVVVDNDTTAFGLQENENQMNEWNGGEGNDTFETSSGTDVFWFERGDGHDTIKDLNVYHDSNGNIDKIIFGNDIGLGDIKISGTSVGDIVISIIDLNDGSYTDSITIEKMYGADGILYGIESFEFSTGESLDFQSIIDIARTITGTSGADTITDSSAIDEIIFGLDGDDAIDSYGGNDEISSGDGHDTVRLMDYRKNFTRTIDLGAGDDYLFMNNYNSGGTNYITAGEGDDKIDASARSSNTADLGAGNDIVDVIHASGSYALADNESEVNLWTGGIGDDTFTTNSAADSFYFNRGDGHDVIEDFNYYDADNGVVDKIVFGQNISLSDLNIAGDGAGNIVVTISDSANPGVSDSITINKMLGTNSDFYSIETFEFSDNTVLNKHEIIEAASTIWGTEGNDVISDTSTSDDIISSLGGDDTINVSGGNDNIDSGSGNDVINLTDHKKSMSMLRNINTGSGNDVIYMNNGKAGGTNIIFTEDGDDVVNGSSYADMTIDFGDGNDSLTVILPSTWSYSDNAQRSNVWVGGQGNDSFSTRSSADEFHFSAGDGQDVIWDFSNGHTTTDTLLFDGSLTKDDIWLSQSGNDLVLYLVGSDDQVTIDNWFSNTSYQIEEIHAGGEVLTSNLVSQLVDAMAAYDVPSGVGNYVPQQVQDDLAPIMSSVWS